MSKLVLDQKVPADYNRAVMADIIRAICYATNSLAEERLASKYQAQASVPTGTAVAYAVGDFVRDSNPTVRGSVAPGLAANYVRIGWICTASGSPGTFEEYRVLTGS